MTKKIQFLGLAAIMLMFPMGKAAAAVYAFSNGDLLLGFTAASGTGVGNDVIIDLGAATSSSLNTGASLNLGTGGISTILSSIYGSTWYSAGNVSAALFNYTIANGPRESWLNTTTNNFNSGKTVRFNLGTIGNNVNGFYGYYNAGGAITTTNIVSGADTYGAVSYNVTANAGGWSATDSGLWGTAVVTPLARTISGATAFNTYYIADNAGVSTQTLLGSVNISSAGVVSVSAVPEPSTYALLGVGSLAALALYRRRSATSTII